MRGPHGCGLSALLRAAAGSPAAGALRDGAVYIDGEAELCRVKSNSEIESQSLEDIAQHLFNRFFTLRAQTDTRVQVTPGEARAHLSKLQAVFAFDRPPLSRPDVAALRDALADSAVLVAGDEAGPDSLLDVEVGSLTRQQASDLTWRRGAAAQRSAGSGRAARPAVCRAG